MDLIYTNCPRCGTSLEFPTGCVSVICRSCGSAYLVREHKGATSLSLGEAVAGSEPESASLDERIADLISRIETLRSNEKGAPLQTGCALFGTFFLAVLVITFFMTLGVNYFGKWPFYLSLAIVVALGLLRMRRGLGTRDEIKWLRQTRARLEDDLSRLETERARVQGSSEDPDSEASTPPSSDSEV